MHYAGCCMVVLVKIRILCYQKIHCMAKQQKTQKQMKVEDAFHNSSVSFHELILKIKEQDALITSLKDNITLLKRQLALQETIFGKMYEFTGQLQQQMNLSTQDVRPQA